jgi:redox-sensitive bicupin YhaK (pirin superfamily)
MSAVDLIMGYVLVLLVCFIPSVTYLELRAKWLKTFHTFSFADYQDSRFMGFGPLRVINEDRVEPTEGFGTHSHREMEIFSYVVKGELEQ